MPPQEEYGVLSAGRSSVCPVLVFGLKGDHNAVWSVFCIFDVWFVFLYFLYELVDNPSLYHHGVETVNHQEVHTCIHPFNIVTLSSYVPWQTMQKIEYKVALGMVAEWSKVLQQFLGHLWSDPH